jgi:hypothetical protein
MNGLVGVKPWRFELAIDPFEEDLDFGLLWVRRCSCLASPTRFGRGSLVLDGVQRLDLDPAPRLDRQVR